jgi:nucleotide-binding universal stress UspA family protein
MTQDLEVQTSPVSGLSAQLPRRIAVGVDGFAPGEDAAALGEALAHATGADLLLVSVHQAPIILLGPEMSRAAMHRDAHRVLTRTRKRLAPAGRAMVEADNSAPRALLRVIEREHCDILVLGSARNGKSGEVLMGSATRQLLGQSGCDLLLAPLGLSGHVPVVFSRIAVGYDGDPESDAALSIAGAIAAHAGAALQVVGVVDDSQTNFVLRAPFGRSGRARDRSLQDERAKLERRALATVASLESDIKDVEVSAVLGSPAETLQQIAESVDLLVIGSRRWGTVARVLLGSTGEALLHGARCPVLVAARPRS